MEGKEEFNSRVIDRTLSKYSLVLEIVSRAISIALFIE